MIPPENERNDLYRDAWDLWGPGLQVDIAIEEMSELIKALLKARRNGQVFNEGVYDEIADVIICMEQLRFMAHEDFVDPIVEFKLERLRQRIKNGVESLNSG